MSHLVLQENITVSSLPLNDQELQAVRLYRATTLKQLKDRQNANSPEFAQTLSISSDTFGLNNLCRLPSSRIFLSSQSPMHIIKMVFVTLQVTKPFFTKNGAIKN